MSDITVSFSKKDFELLFKHVFIGNWVLTSTKDSIPKDINDFYQRFLSVMKNYNIEDDILYDKEINEYMLPMEKESELLEELSDYNETTFYDELVSKLVERDLEAKYNRDELNSMDEDEYMAVFTKEEHRYAQEINKNDIKNLYFKLK